MRAKRAQKIAILMEIRSKLPLDQRFTIYFLRLLNVPLFFFGARACWNPLRLGALWGPGPGTNCPTCTPLCTPLSGRRPAVEEAYILIFIYVKTEVLTPLKPF